MNTKYNKKAKIGMAALLATTSFGYTTHTLLANDQVAVEEEIQEDASLQEEGIEVELEASVEAQEEVSTIQQVEDSVEINETNFPDANFREYIKVKYDQDADNMLSSEDIKGITTIDIMGMNTIQSVAGIEFFSNLTFLDCSSTGITSLDVSHNPILETLYCGTTGITSLDLSNNSKLASLNVEKTALTSLDVSQNTALVSLNCNNTEITSLDVSNLSLLNSLYCSDTKIANLDVSKNAELTTLNCNNTQLKGLDITNNPALTKLFFEGTSIAYLNIGNNSNLEIANQMSSELHIGEVTHTFNLNDHFPGIDAASVTMVSGAHYDKTTGEVRGHQNNQPIVYTYDCGVKAGNESVSLEVTLNFTKILVASEISIQSYEGKVYDGTPVSNPTDIVKTGSSGEVTFEWFTQDENGEWVSLGDQAPINVGSYGVKAHLAADLDYEAADSGEPTPFEIKQASSSVSINSYEGKVYDGTPASNPTDIVKTGSNGEVTFEWFTQDENGEWVSLGNQAPVNAGSYGVKAHLAADQNYTGADSQELTLFEIKQASSSVRIECYEGKGYDGTPASNPSKISQTGSTGEITFEWFSQDENGEWVSLGNQAPTNIGNYGVKAYLAADQNYLAADSGEPTAFTITKGVTVIEILGDLNKEYDGEAVTLPEISVAGNTGLITVEWYQKNADGAWELLTNAPKEIGEYKVVVKVEEDENYLSGELEQIFTITEKTVAEKVEGVQTGDTTQTSMWAMLVGLSMSMMYFFRRKKMK